MKRPRTRVIVILRAPGDFEALKIWMAIKHIGADRYCELVEYLFGLARELASEIEQSEDFELFATPDGLAVLGRCRVSGGKY
jgi:glutamate/tyrosine decarboxylase-like PLP-dependent enzyme